MSQDTSPLLTRIAEALERLAPPPPAEPSFAGARLFRFDPARDAFAPAPDYALALDLLVGVERQKARARWPRRPSWRRRPTMRPCG